MSHEGFPGAPGFDCLATGAPTNGASVVSIVTVPVPAEILVPKPGQAFAGLIMGSVMASMEPIMLLVASRESPAASAPSSTGGTPRISVIGATNLSPSPGTDTSMAEGESTTSCRR